MAFPTSKLRPLCILKQTRKINKFEKLERVINGYSTTLIKRFISWRRRYFKEKRLFILEYRAHLTIISWTGFTNVLYISGLYTIEKKVLCNQIWAISWKILDFFNLCRRYSEQSRCLRSKALEFRAQIYSTARYWRSCDCSFNWYAEQTLTYWTLESDLH